MDHVLWAYFFNVPQVQCVVRSEELVSGSFFPPIVSDFKATQEILARQDGMLLVPDDPLGKVQATGLQGGRIVSQIPVTAPNVERPPRIENASQVAEPR